ncbi:hypothetical protein ACTFQN_06250 [Bacillus cereus group sp. MYBK30-1]|uniref:hypothetical protein n=1 Tax=unclassified Bacillus cereus group TaxID=2750818 RepID=UPI003F7B2303
MAEIKTYRYTVPSVSGEGWGIFLFDSNGAVTAITDFGNFANQFCLTEGEDVRKFLIEMRPDQMFCKIARKSEIDEEQTFKDIEEAILEQTDESKSKKEKESLAQFRTDLEYMPFEFAHFDWYQGTSLDDENAFLVKKYPSAAVRFSNETFVRLQEKLKAELLTNVL